MGGRGAPRPAIRAVAGGAPAGEDRMYRGINLASARLGAEAVACSDDFFAPMSRLIRDSEPEYHRGRYDENGKWMDGWESRRRRGGGFDWCVVRLAVPGRLIRFELDTRHFTGNYPPGAALDGATGDEFPAPNSREWQPLTPQLSLGGDARAHRGVRGPEHRLPLGAPSHLPGRGTRPASGHRPAAGERRTGRAPGALRAAERGAGGGRLRLALRQSGIRHHGRAGHRHGRWLGDGAPAGARQRVDHHRARGARGDGRDRDRHRATSRATTRPRSPSRRRRCPRCTTTRWSPRRCSGRRCSPEQPLGADRIHRFPIESAPPATHIKVNSHPDGGISRIRAFGTPRPD